MPSERSSERGFTLIEVLVALLVTAFLLAVISTALETARTREIRVDDEARALLIGEEYLARRAEARFESGTSAIEHGRYCAEVREIAFRDDPRQLLVLSEISVTVRRGDGPVLYRTSLRRLKSLPVT